MTADRKDSEWLEQMLVGLLQDAVVQSPKDHAACAKYADLLWKMLPRTAKSDPRSFELDQLRRRLIERKDPNAEEDQS